MSAYADPDPTPRAELSVLANGITRPLAPLVLKVKVDPAISVATQYAVYVALTPLSRAILSAMPCRAVPDAQPNLQDILQAHLAIS